MENKDNSNSVVNGNETQPISPVSGAELHSSQGQQELELREPSQQVKASPLELIVSYVLIGAFLLVVNQTHSRLSKESPHASIVQIQTEMQKFDTEETKNETGKLEGSAKSEDIKSDAGLTAVDSAEKVKESAKSEDIKSDAGLTIVDSAEEVPENKDANTSVKDGSSAVKDNSLELSKSLETSVVQPQKIER